jgi:hypothetical protein
MSTCLLETTRTLPLTGRNGFRLRRSLHVAYRVTDETSGELLQEFSGEAFAKGENGALYAAARFATRQAKDEGRAVFLAGGEGFHERRYAPEYTAGAYRPYRVRCSVRGCPKWVHPSTPTEAPRCREHYAADPARVEQAAHARASRHPRKQ